MPAATAEVVADTADRLFSSIVNGDKAAVDRLWSEDIAVWRVGAGRDPFRTDDKARALKVIDWFIRVTTERRYEILDRGSSTTDRSAASSNSTSCTPPGMPANRSPSVFAS